MPALMLAWAMICLAAGISFGFMEIVCRAVHADYMLPFLGAVDKLSFQFFLGSLMMAAIWGCAEILYKLVKRILPQ